MIFKQYYLGCLSHASYLIGDQGTATAAVVDPQRDIAQYLADAREFGVQIKYVFLTHFHADFVAGHLDMQAQTGAEICLGAKADAEFPIRAMRDGDALEFGDVRLKVLETPGHTPEGITILVYDLAKDAHQPQSILTGDTLFIGDVGRPDLLASIGYEAEDLAKMLYHSLTEKILPLPDDTLVYPAHGAGSACGKALSTDTVSTLGEQRKYNYALQPMSEEQFVAVITADQPEAPKYFAHDAIMNRKPHATLEESLQRALKPLTVAQVLELQAQGAQALDVRDTADYEGAHLAKSINIGLGGRFASMTGSLLDKETRLIVIGDPGTEEEAALRLGRIGFDTMAGYLDGGMAALEGHADLVRRTDRITPLALHERLATSEAPLVLDVRTVPEHNTVRIEGSVNIPITQLRERLSELPVDHTLAVQCQSGYRSAAAVGILEQEGITMVTHVVGGMDGWLASRLPTVS